MLRAERLADLARFTIGTAMVEPGLLQLHGPRGTVTLERKVMAVLVELADAGAAISRDRLAQACWNHAVSEDALNRSIAKLRAALARVVGDGLTIETIRGVGYRLRVGPVSQAADGVTVLPALDLEARALAAMFDGSARSVRTAIHYLVQATREQPGSAGIWGSLAMAQVLSLQFEDCDRARAVALAREAATRAQSLSPGEGRSLAALASLEPTYRNWTVKRRMLADMIARADPPPAPLLFQQVLLFGHSGQWRDALAVLEPLAAAAPLVPWIQSARAYALAATGNAEEAFAISLSARERWPEHRLTWFTHFYAALSAGRASAAIDLTIDGTGPDDVEKVEFDLAKELARGMAEANTRAVLAMVERIAGNEADQSLLEQAILASAFVDEVELCLKILDRLYFTDVRARRPSIALPKIGLVHPQERNTAILFLSPLQCLARDARYEGIVAATGLA